MAKFCGGCNVREVTETVIVACSDGKHVKLKFCGAAAKSTPYSGVDP